MSEIPTPTKTKPTRPPAERWRLAQACLAALAVDLAWLAVERAMDSAPDAVLRGLAPAAGANRMPARRSLANACRRRRARNEQCAAGARSPAEVETWPEDLLAQIARRKLARVSKRAGSVAATATALTAALALWEHFKRRDDEQLRAPARMDELRRAKGAL